MGELVQMASFRDRHGTRTEPLLTKAQLCEHLRLSPSWVQKQMQAEKKRPGSGIPFEKFGDGWSAPVRFRLSEVMEALERRNHAA